MNAELLVSNFEQFSKEDFCPLDLFTAASVGSLGKVREIIESSQYNEVNASNKDGWTPLMYAAYYGESSVVRFLLKCGANPDQSSHNFITPLMLAAKCGNLECATILVENGADTNSKDANEWTALFYASSYGHRSILHLLISKGSKVNQCDTKEGLTPLMLAAAAGHELIVRDLLQSGANLLASSKNGATAPSLAVKNGHLKAQNIIDGYLFHKQGSPSALKNQVSYSSISDVQDLLDILGLSKYYPVFKTHGIDLAKFFTLTDENLKEMGIGLLGPRKKIASAIIRWKQSHQMGQNKDAAALPKKVPVQEL